MQNSQNYIDIEVHNKIMQNLRERELQYKTKIIELQKQKDYQINRANDFQQKFKQALLSHGDEVGLIEKLSQKENENNELRMEVIKLKKSIDSMAQNQLSGKGSNQSAQTNKQLLIQNEEMAKTIQELKNAAISAIMAKDDEIEELNEKIAKAEELAVLYQNLVQREETLEKEIEKLRKEAEEEQKALSQKLAKQREKYIQKLEQFQSSLHKEESSKEQLLQKAELLQNNLQNKEQIIYLYQNKLNEFEGAMRQQRKIFEQEKDKLSIQIDNLKDKISLYEKQINNFEKVVAEYNFKERESKILNQRLKDQNAQLQRKISIKKRKNNPKMRSSDIYSSFEGISQKSSFYSSFYKPSDQVKPTTLGEIQELQENDVLDSFIDLEGRGQENEDDEQNENAFKKPQKIPEIDTKQNTTQPQTEISEPQRQKLPEPEPEPVSDHVKVPKQQIEQCNKINEAQKAELQRLAKLMIDHQSELRDLRQRNGTLNKNLQESYAQIERLTKQILNKTAEIQAERQTLAQLRSQNKKSQSQKELMVELENYKQHVFKLENALLIEKLQNAEKQEFMKERTERQRKAHEQKVNKLNEQIKNLSPKKKKGFFGR